MWKLMTAYDVPDADVTIGCEPRLQPKRCWQRFSGQGGREDRADRDYMRLHTARQGLPGKG